MAPRIEPPEAISIYSLNLRGFEVNKFCKETGMITPINLPRRVASRVNIISKILTLAALIDRALIPRYTKRNPSDTEASVSTANIDPV
jgi:hypothetical protein